MTYERLFVYGTLLRDTQSAMHHLLASYGDFVAEGTFQGRLYKVDYYPGVVASNDPNDKVNGELYALREPEVLLAKLDQYEECGPGFPAPTEYLRQRATIALNDGSTCRAWIYIYNHPTDGLLQIASGDFGAHG